LLAVVWPTDTYAGPAWGEWYGRFGALEPAEVGRQMLADLVATIHHNEAARTKNGQNFKIGFIATFVGLGAIIIVAVAR
jgi:hypothetical protein